MSDVVTIKSGPVAPGAQPEGALPASPAPQPAVGGGSKRGANSFFKRLKRLVSDVRALPRVTIDLRCAGTADNDPFFEKVVREFYCEATQRHPKFPLVRNYQYGFSLCHLTRDPADYAKQIESAARRNYKKSCRIGYTFARIDYNDHLQDITAILRSARVRQGRPMPEAVFSREARGAENPLSRTTLHDYPHFGILRDGRLYAFAGCLVAGELCSIETIYGHADHQGDGIVPMMIIAMAEWASIHCPEVKYYAYGTYFGATETMQRFKRKFGFMPHRVRWILG